MTTQPDSPQSSPSVDSPTGESGISTAANTSGNGKSPPAIKPTRQPPPVSTGVLSRQTSQPSLANHPSVPILTLIAIAILVVGLTIDNFWIGIAGAIATLLISVPVVWVPLQQWLSESVSPVEQSRFVAVFGLLAAIFGLATLTGANRKFDAVLEKLNSEAIGSLAEWIGALGQILIAVLAVYIAWRQYVISKDLTIQQNTITQQQTIDAYFQGVSDLALDNEGLLEDWPQERAFSEGRTAAILGSVDAQGKAKVLRFLSQSRLLTPLKRDRHLGRPMLDGNGGYLEDRDYGVRVIDLNVMLAGADLAGTDLRWTELSDSNMVRANLSGCDLVKANLARTILFEANLTGADLFGVRLFYGLLETASPRSRTKPPNYETGAYAGAVVENANFTGVLRLEDEQRYYCCAWCGEQSRKTIPGGCDGIPNKLGR